MFGERLKRARVKAGLPLDGLADLAGNIVSKQAISQYEKNQKNPSSTVLIALANALEVNVEYFFRTMSVEINKVDFRKHSTFGKKKQEMVKENVREELERYLQVEKILDIESNFQNPLADYQIESYEDAEDAAQKLRKEWKLGIDPIVSVVEMLELKEIKVIFMEEDEKFNGLSGWAHDDKRHPFVVLNSTDALPLDRKRFTALHELGHLLLENFNPELNPERVVDRFAGAFLFPAESVVNEFGSKRTSISFEELNHIKQKYKISIGAIMYRLNSLGIINDSMAKRFWMNNRRMKYDDRYPLKNRNEQANRFKNLLAHAYSEKLVSLSKLAELASENVDEALEKYGEAV